MASRSCQSVRADVYSRITAEIVAAIQAGAGECRMPWHHDGDSDSASRQRCKRQALAPPRRKGCYRAMDT
jgi:hypothetical protein